MSIKSWVLKRLGLVSRQELQVAIAELKERDNKVVEAAVEELKKRGITKEHIRILKQDIESEINRSQEYILRAFNKSYAELKGEDERRYKKITAELTALKSQNLPNMDIYIHEQVKSVLAKLIPNVVEDAVKESGSLIAEQARNAVIEAAKEEMKSFGGKVTRKLWAYRAGILVLGLSLIGVLGWAGWYLRRTDADTQAGEIKSLRIDYASQKTQTEEYHKSEAKEFSDYKEKNKAERKTELGELEAKVIGELKTNVSGLTAQIAGLKTGEVQTKGDIDTLKQTYPSLKSEIDKTNEYLKTLQEGMGIYEKRLNGITEQADALDKNSVTKEDFERKALLIVKELADLKDEIKLHEGLDKKYDELNKKYETLQRSVEQLKTSQDASSVQLKLEH